MKILITGASGYLGSHIVAAAINKRYEVVALTRRRCFSERVSWFPYDLHDTNLPKLPNDAHVVIHVAANTTSAHQEDFELELRAAQLLLSATRQMNAKFIFISSQTSRPDAPTLYGRTKWQIEQAVLAGGGWVVRLGQVYGGCEKGLFGLLTNIVRRFPLLPAFYPAPRIQPIHVDDVAEGLLRLIEHSDIPPSILCLASPDTVPFDYFLSILATARIHRKRWFIPIPRVVVQGTSRLLGSALSARMGFAQLTSLFALPRLDSAADLATLGLSLRPLDSGMHRSGSDRRRRLFIEGRALLTYVLKEQPKDMLLRRYVRAIEQINKGSHCSGITSVPTFRGLSAESRDPVFSLEPVDKPRDVGVERAVTHGMPLNLPSWGVRHPILLALIDDSMPHGAEWTFRQDIATYLAEATPQGAYRFISNLQGTRPWMSAIYISRVIVAELGWRMLRLVVRRKLQ